MDLRVSTTAFGVQMVAEALLPAVSEERAQQLTLDDAAEMLALASLTRPGPFTLKALSLGDFWGVKINGRLAAMAGERMKQPGYSELSGVCSHPDFRGGGLGRLLSVFVSNRIMARGEVPYLHAYANNANAIRIVRIHQLPAEVKDERGRRAARRLGGLWGLRLISAPTGGNRRFP
ncbi:GNAT family N-acetyltransferase [Mesorhizobium caraganae]|uniref:GNAT family N-acetyltransferase n=1 Tax=Mesorhizobium caraganae TaxID=483206 RepID=A0ABV1YYK6_9HYPH